jgi:hypothetical protein
MPTTLSPRRRWPRFSLRAFLLFFVVVSIPLGWLAKTIERVHRQRAAVADIFASGGDVRYDYQIRSRPDGMRAPAGPWLLRQLIGSRSSQAWKTCSFPARESQTEQWNR